MRQSRVLQGKVAESIREMAGGGKSGEETKERGMEKERNEERIGYKGGK